MCVVYGCIIMLVGVVVCLFCFVSFRRRVSNVF